MKTFVKNEVATQTVAPKAGEFWLAKFVYEDDDTKFKVRPVLILEQTPFGVKAAFCGTKRLDDTWSRTDVLFSDEEAERMGLQRATRVSFDNRRVLSAEFMVRKIGALGTPGVNLSLLKFREIAEAVQSAGAL